MIVYVVIGVVLLLAFTLGMAFRYKRRQAEPLDIAPKIVYHGAARPMEPSELTAVTAAEPMPYKTEMPLPYAAYNGSQSVYPVASASYADSAKHYPAQEPVFLPEGPSHRLSPTLETETTHSTMYSHVDEFFEKGPLASAPSPFPHSFHSSTRDELIPSPLPDHALEPTLPSRAVQPDLRPSEPEPEPEFRIVPPEELKNFSRQEIDDYYARLNARSQSVSASGQVP
ncbi:hypothetical protein HDV03_005245 [Kappamyces sp. JEL0829]|nr:hypothetical protein HDV03_005245 [Kappamyces sp. JEL0829]